MLLVALIALFGYHTQQRTYITRVADWTLTVRRDTFSGLVSCDLRSGHMRLYPGHLRLELGRRADTSRAVLRADNRQPFILHDVDFALDPNSDLALENPSGGILNVPVREVTGFHRLDVELSPSKILHTFNVSTVAAALNSAADAGCWRNSAIRVSEPSYQNPR